ncbi:collagen alpha-2(I) chain-like [Spodoptera litura]|uniref:Collagen alpha-2(I) chain-like n=1 Tax=Spodoptera litura TaxID=69820 RepID=A0A9J7IV18_SPOLT|nr:collagen alpha-2(I) chain-like [Spodoptera litura]
MNIGVLWCVLVLAGTCSAKWHWPESEAAASVRIDTKVRFIDSEPDKEGDKIVRNVQFDDTFRQPVETDGFYNRPPGSGRYPVRVEAHRAPYRVDDNGIYSVSIQHKNMLSDGTLDSLQYCKCVSNLDCHPRADSRRACGVGKYLCCYSQNKNKVHSTHKNQYFNEVEDDRPMLLPGQENLARPFPPPPASALNGLFGSFGPGHGHDSSHIGVFEKPLGVLVGPDGPTGMVGPQTKHKQAGVLVGPNGPTGIVGPVSDGSQSETAQSGVLVGPVGPSGIMGSYGRRPVLVGPGGPTGIIGPSRGRSPGILVGPGGPTGIIGPAYGRQQGILTGPGGPTGSIGPGRQILVGPSGPSGHVGPQGYFGK